MGSHAHEKGHEHLCSSSHVSVTVNLNQIRNEVTLKKNALAAVKAHVHIWSHRHQHPYSSDSK